MSEPSYHYELIPDSFDEFLAQLLTGVRDTLPGHTTLPAAPLPSSSASLFTSAGAPDPNFPLTCQWVVRHAPTLICGASLPMDDKEAAAHFRHVHDIRGNEKVIVHCAWHECSAPPMLRGSLIRHVLSVHLGLLRWQCHACGRVFSRRATMHACVVEEA